MSVSALPVLPQGARYPSCTCAACQALCSRFPGWLSPNDVRRLARHLGVAPVALFRTHLAFDRWFDSPEDTVVVLPANAYATPGEMTDREAAESAGAMPRSWWDSCAPRVPCALLTAGRCTIHDAKPRECRAAYSTQCEHHPDRSGDWHRRIARAWARPAARRFLDTLRCGSASPGRRP